MVTKTFKLEKVTLLDLKKEIELDKSFVKRFGKITKTRKPKRLKYDYEFMTDKGYYGVLDLKNTSSVSPLTYTGKKDFTK